MKKQLNLLHQRISKKKDKKIKINFQKFWIWNEMENKKKLKKGIKFIIWIFLKQKWAHN